MVDLLPSTSDAEVDSEPRVLGVDSEEAGEALAALSSDTAREMLRAFHDDPDTPSGVAGRLDLSLQNAQYHISNLEEASLIETVDTVYSEKGREMRVYGPADAPLVVYAGREDDASGIRAALSRLLGGVAVLGFTSFAVQAFVGELGLPFAMASGPGPSPSDGAATGPATTTATDAGGFGVMEATETATAQPTTTPAPETAAATANAAENAAGLPPGLLFFLGGLTVLLGVALVWWLRRR